MARGTVWFDGAALRQARAHADGGRGLSLDEAARKLAAAGRSGISRQTLIGYESGISVPEPARLVALAKVFDTTAAALSALPTDRARLADLRHWAGLTADQAAAAFELSRWSLLRLERAGVLPLAWEQTHAREGFIDLAARIYAVSPAAVDSAWQRVLGSPER